jgi:hypothetical protein
MPESYFLLSNRLPRHGRGGNPHIPRLPPGVLRHRAIVSFNRQGQSAEDQGGCSIEDGNTSDHVHDLRSMIHLSSGASDVGRVLHPVGRERVRMMTIQVREVKECSSSRR